MQLLRNCADNSSLFLLHLPGSGWGQGSQGDLTSTALGLWLSLLFTALSAPRARGAKTVVYTLTTYTLTTNTLTTNTLDRKSVV